MESRNAQFVKTWTPWGISQYKYKYTHGVNFYGTAGHGGFKVSDGLLRTMPDHLKNSDGWYEEDCEWCKVALAFPELFTDEQLEQAKVSFTRWFNDCGKYKS